MHSRRRAGPPVRISPRTTLNHQEIHLRGTASMAHEIETFTDGTAAFFTARTDAWHRLGTVTTGCLTAAQGMDVAYLGGWDVRKETLQTVASGAAVPNRWATTRKHPKTGQREVLGMVGK